MSESDHFKFDYIVTVDWWKEGSFNLQPPATNTSIAVLYPTLRHLDVEQRRYISDFVNRLDARVVDHTDDISDVVDLESFARYFILQEISKDIDGYGLSNFLKITRGKLVQQV